LEANLVPEPHAAVKSYLICAIPRTGSYLLCDMLRATGVAGNPNEYFSDSYQRHWAAEWGTTDYDSYLRRVVQIATTPNGVVGVKTHPWQFNHFARQASGRSPVRYLERPRVLERWFPDMHYVWLRRKDRLRQAISYTKSLQTNIWWDADTEPVPNARPKSEALAYDFDLITQSVARMVEEEDMWRRYFATVGADPIVIYYEDLAADPERSVKSVLQMLGVDPVADYRVESPSFRKQADDVTTSWVSKYRGEIARGPYRVWRDTGPRKTPATADPATTDPATTGPVTTGAATTGPVTTGAATTDPVATGHPTERIDFHSALGSSNWLRCNSPFPYVRARDVFSQSMYSAMADQYSDLLSGGQFGRGIPGYDVTAYTVTGKTTGPLSLFCQRPWHDMLARLFGINATGELNIALHHHAVGSLDGSPHNDLNPGWFADAPRSDGIFVHDPVYGCDYRYGAKEPETTTVERVRAIAVIFYLANPVRGAVGGETGLYRAASDPIRRPADFVPPVNNSLVAFECTPTSFHGFISNQNAVRNCLVMWLHREKKEAIRRWGESSIVYWRR
jgi:LPS sulfotransferase NodH